MSASAAGGANQSFPSLFQLYMYMYSVHVVAILAVS